MYPYCREGEVAGRVEGKIRIFIVISLADSMSQNIENCMSIFHKYEAEILLNMTLKLT